MNGLKAIKPLIVGRYHLPDAFHALLQSPAELELPPVFFVDAPPLCHRLCSGEHPSSNALSGSSSSAAAVEP
jgi:hypothetical protein